MEKEKIILKSANPSEYSDLEIECRVIENNQIGDYLQTIPEERKTVAYKTGVVEARVGTEGEVINTTLKTIVDGREYILSEEENSVKMRTFTIKNGDGTEEEYTRPDVVITNISSTSDEQYIVKQQKFIQTYTDNADGTFTPVAEPRVVTQVDENVMFMTSWGAPAVCLAGSYIVTYDASSNDYNTIEQGAFKSTYTVLNSSKGYTKKNS